MFKILHGITLITANKDIDVSKMTTFSRSENRHDNAVDDRVAKALAKENNIYDLEYANRGYRSTTDAEPTVMTILGTVESTDQLRYGIYATTLSEDELRETILRLTEEMSSAVRDEVHFSCKVAGALIAEGAPLDDSRQVITGGAVEKRPIPITFKEKEWADRHPKDITRDNITPPEMETNVYLTSVDLDWMGATIIADFALRGTKSIPLKDILTINTIPVNTKAEAWWESMKDTHANPLEAIAAMMVRHNL